MFLWLIYTDAELICSNFQTLNCLVGKTSKIKVNIFPLSKTLMGWHPLQ